MSAIDLRLGDCIEGMKTLADKSIDHVISDPPFEAEAHTLQRRSRGVRGAGVMCLEPLTFPPMTEVERDAVAEQMARVARRWVMVFCQIEASQKWVFSLADAGLVYRRTCIWVKPDGMPQYSGDRPGMGYETLVVMHAPGRSAWNGGGRTGVFTHNKNDSDRTGHPTQKPESLMCELVRLFTDANELILDPYAGSGTTGVAAIRLGRRFIGFERDHKYHSMATKRLRATREQRQLFDDVKPRESEQLGIADLLVGATSKGDRT